MPPARKTASAPAKSISGVDARRAYAAAEAEEVTVKLAHPLNEGNPFTKDGEPADAGVEVKLTRANARHLIRAGYAAIDAEDDDAVRTALQLGPGETTNPPED